jgi:hypothetical protein
LLRPGDKIHPQLSGSISLTLSRIEFVRFSLRWVCLDGLAKRASPSPANRDPQRAFSALRWTYFNASVAHFDGGGAARVAFHPCWERGRAFKRPFFFRNCLKFPCMRTLFPYPNPLYQNPHQRSVAPRIGGIHPGQTRSLLCINNGSVAKECLLSCLFSKIFKFWVFPVGGLKKTSEKPTAGCFSKVVRSQDCQDRDPL